MLLDELKLKFTLPYFKVLKCSNFIKNWKMNHVKQICIWGCALFWGDGSFQPLAHLEISEAILQKKRAFFFFGRRKWISWKRHLV